MQQRRGTAAQWTSANPVLNAAEMGWESDTNKFKIGDGVNHWADLDYFIDANSTVNPSFGSSITFEGATANDFETTLAVTDPTADRTITFPDATGTVALTSDISELSQDAVDAALTAGTGITKTYNDGANTLTLAVDTTTIQARVTDVSDTEIGYLNGVTSGIQTQLDNRLALAGGTMTGAIAMGTSKITGLGTPTDAADATTKAYVDAVTEGLHIHPSVVAATTANVALSTALENGDTIDGITLATGNRILVKNQTTQSENGIYVVQASGQPTRATDFDTAAEVDSGDFVFVSSGTINGGTGWVQVNRPATIGTDAIAFTQFSGAGTYLAGNGLTLTGNSFSIDATVTADLSTSQTLNNKSLTNSSLNAPFIENGINFGVMSGGTGSSGQVIKSTGTGAEWATISEYSAPTIGSTSIASGATVTTIAGLTLTAPVVNLSINEQTGTSYTVALSDNGKLVTLSNAGAITVTVPTNDSAAYATGSQINLVQLGAGTVSVVGDSGVSVLGTPGLNFRAQYSSATLIKINTNSWLLAGDLSA